jgi:hypothetical protein
MKFLPLEVFYELEEKTLKCRKLIKRARCLLTGANAEAVEHSQARN